MNKTPKSKQNADGGSDERLVMLFQFLAATITGSNERKGSEMPAEGKRARQSAGTASGGFWIGDFRSPDCAHQMKGTPASLFQHNVKVSQPTKTL